MIEFFSSLSHRQRLAALVYGLMVLGLMMLAAQPSHPRPSPALSQQPVVVDVPQVAAN